MPRWEQGRKRLCKHGHDLDVVGQYKNGKCRLCAKAYARDYDAYNPENRKARDARYRTNHSDEIAAYYASWYGVHTLDRAIQQTMYRADKQLSKLKAQSRELWGE